MARRNVTKIAKALYTEHRGRVAGNTRPWDDLSLNERYNIVYATVDLIEIMEETWQTNQTKALSSDSTPG